MNDTKLLARLPRLVLLALLLLPSAGCLAFEKQTMIVAFPKDRDEVRFLMVYEGLCVAGEGKGNLTKAKEELAELVTTDKVFYLGSPILRIPLTEQKDE